MPFPNYANPQFPPAKEIPINWGTFRGGWNTFKREVELDADELAEAKNLILVGSGIPTKRWGSQNLFQAAATGSGRAIFRAEDANENEEILALTDWGLLTKQNGASYTEITGASWPSGYNANMVQLNNKVYIVSEQREMARYNFSNIESFVTIAPPTGVTATNFSGATGARTQSWRITAVSEIGETIGSTAISLTSLPQDLGDTLVKLQWTATSAASGVLKGYNIYRGLSGDERWLAAVDSDVTEYDDVGTDTSLIRTLPTADTTGGLKAKFNVRFQDRIVLAGIPGDPTKVYISGRVPNHERFDWSGGGGFVLIDPDDGEPITGLGVHRDSILVFKENSVFEVKLSLVTIGSFVVLEPVYRLLTASQGCSSHRSIVAVENDVGVVSRRGMFIVGQQPRFDTTIRTAEISARIRPFFESLSEADITGCNSVYVRGKWIVNFPDSKRSIMFDRERLAFMGPWPMAFGINQAIRYTDSNNNQKMVAIDSDDNFATDFLPSYLDDKGTAIATRLKSRKENYNQWELFKTLREMYFQFRNVFGDMTINVFIETRDGQTAIAKNFSLTADAARTGWGIDQWGTVQWGLSTPDAKASSDELIRKVIINRTVRTYQAEIETTSRESNYELLNIKSKAIPQGPGIEPSDTWNVS